MKRAVLQKTQNWVSFFSHHVKTKAFPAFVVLVACFYFISTDIANSKNAHLFPNENLLLMDTFDLALRKTTNQIGPAEAGDIITFTITVFNQGNITAQDILVMDSFPAGTALLGGWIPVGNHVTNIIPGPILPGDSAQIEIELEILPGVIGSLTNFAEIVGSEDDLGNDRTLDDIDSTADEDANNDNFIDNEINDDGSLDEDDHDTESIMVCENVVAGLDLMICQGDTVQLMASLGTNYLWSPGEGLSCTDCPTPFAFPDSTTTYIVTSDDSLGCVSSDSVIISVGIPIQIDSILSANPTDCDIQDGQISIFASEGSGVFEYSINGGLNWQSSNEFSTLTADTYITAVRNNNGSCGIFGDTIILETPNTPQISIVIANDPSMCDSLNGSIEIEAINGTGTFEYSIDGGNNWLSSNLFENLGSGNYPVAVRNDDETCAVFGDLIVLSTGADEPAITNILSTNPTDCSVLDGTITVMTSNDNGTFEYSNNGGIDWQVSNAFNGLGEGSYEMLIRNGDSTCLVLGGSINLLDPSTPSLDSITFQNPIDCNSTNGSISVFANLATGVLEYSIDSGLVWQTENIFENLNDGVFEVLIRNEGTTCTINGGNIELEVSNEPVITNISPVNPSECGAEDGSIVIEATPCPNNNLEYSIDGGDSWSPASAFGNLPAGEYEIAVRNEGSQNMISGGVITLEGDLTPIINSVNSSEPTACNTPDGTVEIIATPCGSNELEYSVDAGDSWQSTGLFENLPGGCYETAIRNLGSSEIILGDTIILNAPGEPVIIETILEDPDCNGQGGSITINAVGNNGNIEYSIDGGQTWLAENVFADLTAGVYPIMARGTGGGCEFDGGTVELVQPEEPEIIGVTFNDPTACEVSDGTLTIIATGNGSIEYSIDGGNTWSATTIYQSLPEGVYNIFIRNADGSCQVEYVSNPIVLTEPAEPPTLDDVITTDASCNTNDGVIEILASGNGSIEYSIDNGNNFQNENIFSNLLPNTYEIVIRFQGSPCLADSTIILNGSNICNDTMSANIIIDNPSEVCLDPSVFQIQGTITSAEFCDQGNMSTVFASSVNDDCIMLDPANGFSGLSPDLICVVHCFDNNPDLCDTTFLEITVEMGVLPCDDVIAADTVSMEFAGDPTEVCIPLPILAAINFDLVLNGIPYDQQLLGCDDELVTAYSYIPLTGGGFMGPYSVDNWTVNGEVFNGFFSDVNDLVDLLNMWDPIGNWMLNDQLFLIMGGDQGNVYGDLNITHIPTANASTLTPNTTNISNGTIINANNIGVHLLEIIDGDTGCTDTLYLEITGDLPPMIDIDTIEVNTPINTTIEEICFENHQLPGGISSMGMCEMPSNGMINVVNDSCIAYIPNPDFVGKDTFCLMVCDDVNPIPNCDSLLIIACVLPPPMDTLNITMNQTETLDTCLTDFIQLANISTTQLCGANLGEINVPTNGTCLTLDPNDTFSGTTEVCIVSCNDAIPAICDTTIIIVNVLETPCPDIIPIDEFSIMVDELPADVCVPVSSIQAADLEISINGNLFNDPLVGCIPDPPFANGTLYPMDLEGMNEFIMIDSNGCADTLIINVGINPPPVSNIDTVYASTHQGITIDEICGIADDLPGLVFSIGFCGLPSNGIAPVLSDSCVMYIPEPNYIGNDEFCLVICDDNLPTNCDSTIVIVSVLPPIDTIFIETDGLLQYDTCINSALQLPGALSSAETCGFNSDEVVVAVGGVCVIVDLENDFEGTTEACVVHCDNSVPPICDTTILVITNGMPCEDVFPLDTLTVISDTNVTEVCLPLPVADFLMYGIELDGNPYGGSILGCDFDSAYVYSFALVFEQFSQGPYDVEWEANGEDFAATVQNVSELLDSMNVWDPAGSWMLSQMTFTLMSDNDQGNYGIMDVSHPASMTFNQLQAIFTGIPFGTQIIVEGFGFHTFVIENPNTGCTDTLIIEILDENQFINIETFENTPSVSLCLDTLDFPGNFDTLMVCEEPLNGQFLINENCFTYLPGNGFLGMDEGCLVLCDDMMNCDTFFISINVIPLCNEFDFLPNDTLQFFTEECAAGSEYCLPIALDSLLTTYNILDNGFPYSGNIVGCDLDTCVFYDYSVVPGLGEDGPYTLDAWPVNDSTYSGGFSDIFALVDSMNFWDATSAWTIDTNMFTISNCSIGDNTYGDIEITQDGTGAMGIAGPTPLFLPNGSQIQIDTGFHHLMFLNFDTGCTDTLLANVMCEIDSTSCGIMALSPEFIQIDDCDTTTQFCIGVPVFDAANFIVTVNDSLFSDSLTACLDDPSNIAIQLDTGFYEIVLEDTIKNCVDTFLVTISCATIDDTVIDTTVFVGDSLLLCLEDLGYELATVDSVVNVCVDQGTGNAAFSYDEITGYIDLEGLQIGLDTACYKVYFADTCSTVFINAEVVEPCLADLFDQEVVGGTLEDCSAGGGDICLPVTILELQDYAIEVNGTAYTGNISGCNFDSTFTLNCSLLPGNGQNGPYLVDLWTIDTTTVSGAFENCESLIDSMNIWDPTGNWELLGSTIVGGDPTNSYGSMMITQESTGAQTILGVNASFVPQGTLITLPFGTFTLAFRDTLTGCRDTVIATLACLSSEIFLDTVDVGETDTLCFNTDDLPGELVSIENVCEDESGEFVLFEILNDTCVIYTGIEFGMDTACIVLCDDLGVCDTTFMQITTLDPNATAPIAVKDSVITGEGQPVVINVFGNDTIISLDDFFILTPPNNGAANFLNDGSVNYVPNPNYCDSAIPDTFEYVICNFIGCDTATVCVIVECTELQIFNGFSPNGDGFNDFFTIQGLQLYPNHILRVYNRWGSRVYETANYQNNWDGIWNGKDLPDGTYFYYLDLGDGEERKGYVQLQR